jgi:predicted NUDIX family NTP pyrophosphohydrolase
MVADDREPGTAACRETTEEAAQAIAGALEFLRDEAQAVGLYDVEVAIELARATASGYCRQSSESGDRR